MEKIIEFMQEYLRQLELQKIILKELGITDTEMFCSNAEQSSP